MDIFYAVALIGKAKFIAKCQDLLYTDRELSHIQGACSQEAGMVD